MPETKFSKEFILTKSIEVAKEKGIAAITARGIASELKSSVAPIYDNFGNIDNLKDAVYEELHKIHMQTIAIEYTDNYFLNVGIGTMKFAEEYKMVYQDYLIKRGMVLSLTEHDETKKKVLTQMRMDKYFDKFTDDDLLDILMKMEIFTNGLSNMVSMGLFDDKIDEKDMIKILGETGQAIIIDKLR